MLNKIISLVDEQILLVGSLVCAEVLYRWVTVPIEYFINWKHYSSKRRLITIIRYAFTLDEKIKKIVIPFLVLIGIYVLRNESALECLKTNFLKLSVPYLILRLLNFTHNNVELAKFIRSGVGIDYATGMASSYFHGYLHLQLPKTGHTTKGLKERIEDYEDSELSTAKKSFFPIKKLCILIPQSMHTKPTIESEIMKPVKPLETVNLDRAGVLRPFKNAVYRIDAGDEDNSSWYVVLEGATPMMSFYESLMHSWTRTTAMEDMQREITLQFFRALKKIIASCPDTKDLVELIYYNDLLADGTNVDVGEIVRQRIIRLRNVD